MKPILEIQHVSKKFYIGGEKSTYLSLRDSLSSFSFTKNKNTQEFYALRDVSFNVMEGESLAIIGKNGAGKSTLLKILSKITPPSSGKIIARGRIASLLEVGTGFHPELTGRENIFLNGSILGLTKKEIISKFDEIIDFSGVEKFLDTPLKHYSSGMQLRLAFAVAANLDPEILVIDEVLAVGDSVFQQKCIDKMTDISRSGKTLLFVSHNVPAIKNLCQKAILLQGGNLVFSGDTSTVLDQYLSESSHLFSQKMDLSVIPRKKYKDDLVFSEILFNKELYFPGDPLELTILLKQKKESHQIKDLTFGVNILDNNRECIYHLSNIFIEEKLVQHQDTNKYVFHIPQISLKPGRYIIALFLNAENEIQDWIMDGIHINIEKGNKYMFSNSDLVQGIVQPDFSFSVK